MHASTTATGHQERISQVVQGHERHAMSRWRPPLLTGTNRHSLESDVVRAGKGLAKYTDDQPTPTDDIEPCPLTLEAPQRFGRRLYERTVGVFPVPSLTGTRQTVQLSAPLARPIVRTHVVLALGVISTLLGSKYGSPARQPWGRPRRPRCTVTVITRSRTARCRDRPSVGHTSLTCGPATPLSAVAVTAAASCWSMRSSCSRAAAVPARAALR